MQRRDLYILLVIAIQFVGLGVYLYSKLPKEAPAKPLAVKPQYVIGKDAKLVGNLNAPVTLVEFGDYECPPCSRAHTTVARLLEKYPADVTQFLVGKMA